MPGLLHKKWKIYPINLETGSESTLRNVFLEQGFGKSYLLSSRAVVFKDVVTRLIALAVPGKSLEMKILRHYHTIE